MVATDVLVNQARGWSIQGSWKKSGQPGRKFFRIVPTFSVFSNIAFLIQNEILEPKLKWIIMISKNNFLGFFQLFRWAKSCPDFSCPNFPLAIAINFFLLWCKLFEIFGFYSRYKVTFTTMIRVWIKMNVKISPFALLISSVKIQMAVTNVYVILDLFQSRIAK